MGLPIKKKTFIKTERLVLKPYSKVDTENMIELLTNSEITKTFMVPDFETRDQLVELVKKLINFSNIEDVKHLEYGIYLNNILIGFVNDCGIENKVMPLKPLKLL